MAAGSTPSYTSSPQARWSLGGGSLLSLLYLLKGVLHRPTLLHLAGPLDGVKWLNGGPPNGMSAGEAASEVSARRNTSAIGPFRTKGNVMPRVNCPNMHMIMQFLSIPRLIKDYTIPCSIDVSVCILHVSRDLGGHHHQAVCIIHCVTFHGIFSVQVADHPDT